MSHSFSDHRQSSLLQTTMPIYTSLFCCLILEMRPTLEAKQRALRAQLDEKLWSAACWRDYQLSCVQRTYDNEIEQIERDFEVERNQIKDRLIADLLEHRKRLIEVRDRIDGGDRNPALTKSNFPDCIFFYFCCSLLWSLMFLY